MSLSEEDFKRVCNVAKVARTRQYCMASYDTASVGLARLIEILMEFIQLFSNSDAFISHATSMQRLRLNHARINTTELDQLVVIALLDQPALIKAENDVCLLYRTESVGDSDSRSSLARGGE